MQISANDPAGASLQSTQNFQHHHDVLNSSSITDNNKNRFPQPSPHHLSQPQNNVVNTSVISRASALQSNQAFAASQQNGPGQDHRAGTGKQLTPRQFKNIDNIDKREQAAGPAKGSAPGLQRQVPQIQGFNFESPHDKGAAFYNPEIIIPPILYKLNTRCQLDNNRYAQDGRDASLAENRQEQSSQQTSNFLPYYCMPSQHVFDTWIMYLESILKEVYSVEGSEQILLEALNYLALTIYFGEGSSASSGLMGQFKQFGGDFQSPLISPASERSSRGLALGRAR